MVANKVFCVNSEQRIPRKLKTATQPQISRFFARPICIHRTAHTGQTTTQQTQLPGKNKPDFQIFRFIRFSLHSSCLRNEKMAAQPALGVTQTYAAVVQACPSHQQEQPTTHTTKMDAGPPVDNTEMTITQQLQLILAKLDMQEKAHTTQFSRLERLEKNHPSKRILNGRYSTNYGMEFQRTPMAQRTPPYDMD
jgi:hypothetical protein